MKRLIKAIIIAAIALMLMAFSANAEGDESLEYVISETGAEYVLSCYENGSASTVIKSASFGEIMDYLSEKGQARLLFADVTLKDAAELSGEKFQISGTLTLSADAILAFSCAETYLTDITVNSYGGFLRIKEGSVFFTEGAINSYESCAVVMDYTASAKFKMSGGSIYTESEDASILLTCGSAVISGGEIRNTNGAAIESSSTLILSGSPRIRGIEYGVITSKPIILSDGGTYFDGELSVKYNSKFNKGTINCVIYSASESSLEAISLYDVDGEKQVLSFFTAYAGIAEKNFGAVYLPYEINFYNNGELVGQSLVLAEEIVESIVPPEKSGYEFLGWSTSENETLLYDFAQNVNSSFDLYAKYKLLPPSFLLSSLEFTYDGEEHKFGITELSHPLIESAIINYTWYRDGIEVSNAGPQISISKVKESGLYKCKISFSYGTDTVSFTTSEVGVTVNKCKISLPEIENKFYNGEYQTPDVYSTSLYEVSESGGVIVGVYPVTVTLRDTDNYEFEGGGAVAYSEFQILKAENFWTESLNVPNIYEGAVPLPVATARFGKAEYLFSPDYNGPYSVSIPSSSGIYYCIARVSGTENYEELISVPVSFYVIEERITGISIFSMPDKCDYVAFDSFVSTGLQLLISYNSQRTKIVGADEISVSYQSAETLRYGDSAVVASYTDMSIPVPINVEKAEYDISDISFLDKSVLFNDTVQSIVCGQDMPIGLDGIALQYEIEGCGRSAGQYQITLTFYTESKNYKLPSPIKATLTILPVETNVIFTDTDFVYDGSLKLPGAYYVDIYGRKVTLEVSGARSLAGEYTATAVGSDSNYVLKGAVTVYKIAKADYDFSGICWIGGDFVYDGLFKSVILSGLPTGVSVIGYSDNKAANAGEYVAKATLTYDENNYNPPPEIVYNWKIKKAEYDLSQFSFADVTRTFNGCEQFPELLGEMPVGVDGIKLEYSFNRGALHVGEGKKAVQITFSTQSNNYNVPDSQTAYVEIIPLGITVNWTGLEFVYNSFSHAPMAQAIECAVSVLGSKTNAGEHTATAVALNSDYYVINSTVVYVIKKAENRWTSPLIAEDVFEGKALSPNAVCVSGDVEYVYYSDAEGTNKISPPTLPGIYYVEAISQGSINYLPITSEKVRFEIIKVVPISMSVTLSKNEYFAFESVSGDHISIVLLNNDGTLTSVDGKNADVTYQSAESLRVADSYITVAYRDFEQKISISVKKANYNMSDVRWSASSFTYDGEKKTVSLIGLPDGVSVSSYFGESAVSAGEYTAGAVLEYDFQNYNEPTLPVGSYKIKKQTVSYPDIAPLVYNGNEQMPALSQSELYSSTVIRGKNAGFYGVLLKLTDAENYEFPDSSSETTVYYEIVPLKITVKISDVDKYLFSAVSKPTYTVIEGATVSGEVLEPVFTYVGDEVSCIFENPNYSVTVVPGKIVKHNSLSEDTLFCLFLIFLIVLTLALVIVVLIRRKSDIKRYVSIVKCRLSPVSKTNAETVEQTENPEPEAPFIPTNEENDITVNSALSVNADRADGLISDSLAKNLLRRGDTVIETEGNKKRIINVDTLSESFSSGDSVDVNKLKEMSLVPYDTAYIKVLARGMIDKPLKVYANDFSLSAIKMLALTGGEAIRVVTVRKKTKKQTVKLTNFPKALEKKSKL